MTNLFHKSCVFCGSKPNRKNKEHVIPKWLIKKTGDNKRIFYWPEHKKNGVTANENIPFDQFTFPACTTCNEKYSRLESQAKLILEKIERSIGLTSLEIDVFLDWFDKVRIGVWLALLYLNKKATPVTPNFFIEQRIAKKDRYLAIFRRNDDVFRCSIPCSNTPAFEFMPSAVCFVFNSFCFISISDDFLIAKNLGWPFPEVREICSNGMLSLKMHEGTKKIRIPILPFHIEGEYTQIFQQIANVEIVNQALYLNAYVQNQLMPGSQTNGIVKVFDSSNKEILSDALGAIDCTPKVSVDVGEVFVSKVSIETLKVQSFLWKKTRSANDSKGHSNRFSAFKNLCINFNLQQIKAHELEIRKVKSEK